ncbi:uncharacterized protein LOC132248557 [Alligator mississippiensis]|uniref:uncharacterized protein LOC132248557 n=1 Tax=Alligator mississippiensis TaxID=8496 RepID=UPI0028780033|nr:uncharacterized protein LOC132248557 [Alligator mississippiensis]
MILQPEKSECFFVGEGKIGQEAEGTGRGLKGTEEQCELYFDSRLKAGAERSEEIKVHAPSTWVASTRDDEDGAAEELTGEAKQLPQKWPEDTSAKQEAAGSCVPVPLWEELQHWCMEGPGSGRELSSCMRQEPLVHGLVELMGPQWLHKAAQVPNPAQGRSPFGPQGQETVDGPGGCMRLQQVTTEWVDHPSKEGCPAANPERDKPSPPKLLGVMSHP